MLLNEFAFLTEQDKRHFAYGLCVFGTAATGAAYGSMAGGQTLVGAAGGTVVGLFMCKAVEQPLKQKLFSANIRMSEKQFLSLAQQTKTHFPHLSRLQVLDLLAASRIEAAKQPSRYRCLPNTA